MDWNFSIRSNWVFLINFKVLLFFFRSFVMGFLSGRLIGKKLEERKEWCFLILIDSVVLFEISVRGKGLD